MRQFRRKVLIPSFELSEVCNKGDHGAAQRNIKQWVGREAFTYYYRPVSDPLTRQKFNYNLFPVVLDRAGVPWDLANNYLLSKLEAETYPNMDSYMSLADDLGAYREWLDGYDNPVEILIAFPKMKQRRPTYRYRG